MTDQEYRDHVRTLVRLPCERKTPTSNQIGVIDVLSGDLERAVPILVFSATTEDVPGKILEKPFIYLERSEIENIQRVDDWLVIQSQ